ncbi:MAG: DUF7594 domain-containing protein, partial [Terriglobales bacterium]
MAVAGQTVTASQDAYVVPGNGLNFGTVPAITVGSFGSEGLVQFDLTQLPAGLTGSQILRATLTLFANHVNVAGLVTVHVADGGWTETGVNGNAAPAPGATVGSVSVASANAFVTLDVTAAVQNWMNGGENDGFLIEAASGASVQFDSKENPSTSHPAQLNLYLASTGPVGPAGPPGAPGPPGMQG